MEHHLTNMHYVPAPVGKLGTFSSDQDCLVIGLYVASVGLATLYAAPGGGFHPAYHLDPTMSCRALRAGQTSFAFEIQSNFTDAYLVVLSASLLAPMFTFSVSSEVILPPAGGGDGPEPEQSEQPQQPDIIASTIGQGNRRYLVFFESGGVVALVSPEGYTGDYPQPHGSTFTLPAGWALG